MRFIYACFILLTMANVLSAQLEIHPLQSNPILEQYSLQHHNQHPEYQDDTAAAELRGAALDCAPPEGNIYGDQETAYVVSGKGRTICVANASYPEVSCLNCDDLMLGTAVLNNNCFVYTANAGILADSEQLDIEQCNMDGDCIQLSIQIMIGRPGQKISEPLQLINGDDDLTICANSLDLPGDIDQSRFLNCHDPSIGRVVNGDTKDACFLFEATRFAEQDTVCFEICDINCICDTLEVFIRVGGDTLNLPFMDDFSYSYSSPLPDPNKWLDNRVYINNEYAYQPPSIGVATFDGLTEGGRPYGTNNGVSDVLTSNYLNLNGPTAYLSFHVQPKGTSFQPEPSDSLVLQFKTDQGKWNTVALFNGMGPAPLDSFPSFRFWNYEIDEEEYLFDGFQFRFLSFGERYSTGDIWNLDYVRLSTDVVIDSTFEDAAFTAYPSRLLKNYYDMPWWHFEGFETQELIDSANIQVYNQFPEIVKAEPSRLFVREITTNSLELDLGILLEDPQLQRNLAPGEHQFFTNSFYDFESIIGHFSGEQNLIFETEYTMEVEQEIPGEYPQVSQNNTVYRKTYFQNFFSRDDGSAEGVASLNNVGQEMAIRYTANVADTLRAIHILFPHFVNSNNALFNLKVWIGDLESDAVYAANFLRPYFADSSFDTLQGFTTFPLVDITGALSPIALAAGQDFFIGVQQASALSDRLYVGLDFNSPSAQNDQFINTGLQWLPIPTPAAIMMRPVVGSDTPPSTQSVATSDVEDIATKIKVYPNPANEQVFFDVEDGDYQRFILDVYDASGRLLESGLLEQQKNLKALQNGVYFLRIVDLKTRQVHNHKLIIVK